MESWSVPDIPQLPGSRPQLRLYDSADRQVRPVAPGPTATMYVCGITPYDATHLGHAATYLAFDLVYRLLLDAGHAVHYVQNITDVDDPLFERADRDGIDWRDLGAREIQLFRDDMAALRVLPPHDYVAATDAIAEVIVAVEKMLASGAAYWTPCTHCSPSAAAIRTGPAKPIRWTPWCGARCDPANRVGRRRSAPAGPAGTSSVRRSRWTAWVWASTFRAAAAT